MDGEGLGYLGVLGLFCWVITVFFILRGIKCLQAWRNGEKDELWRWISLFLGAGGSFLSGTLLLSLFWGAKSSVLAVLIDLTFVGLLLALAAVALTTVYYIFKWRASK
jgi:hypothetical protein